MRTRTWSKVPARFVPRFGARPLVGLLLAVSLLAALPSGAVTVPEEPDSVVPAEAPRQTTPEDRYALAGGCYVVRPHHGDGAVVRQADGFAVGADDQAGEPFFFKATDLGRYLLFGTAEDFLAATEGAVGQAGDAATENTAAGIASGLTLETTDAVVDAARTSPAGSATGRGAAVTSAAAPSELADWEIDRQGNGFTIALPATGQVLVADNTTGELRLEPAPGNGNGRRFTFELATGCAEFPEVDVNVDGPVAAGATPFTEVRGFFEAHLHMMAFEFIGGRVRCGRPWHRYGVAEALVDCPDHEPGGRGGALEAILSGGNPGDAHATDGWPTFSYWPRYNSLTHEQVYYKWLERAWRGGQRLAVNLLVDNNKLCQVYPYKKHGCNEMDGVRLQLERIQELERYIDAQEGGPGEGWFRLVDDPFEARQVANSGKLAVVLGIEVSVLFDCGVVRGVSLCTTDQIDERLDAVYDAGVRQMELVNKFDNALSGVTGDAGSFGLAVNGANFLETGSFWRMDTCADGAGDAQDKRQINVYDETQPHAHDHGFDDEHDATFGRDSIFGAVAQVSGVNGASHVYPQGPHCNQLGLSELGEHLIRRMAERGMIFDPDHMSAKARAQSMDLIEQLGYSGVVSSHSWADDTIYPRIWKAGGVVAPHAGSSAGFVEKWRKQRSFADGRYLFGLGFGSDMNGFSTQGAPRGPEGTVTYPFTGFGGVTVDRQRSGERVYDINVEGVAHYGLYPDWIEDLRVQAGEQIVEDLARGTEAYLQMWERAVGIAPDACRADVPDLTAADLDRVRPNMTWIDVLGELGQPTARTGTTFTYCVDGGAASVEFSPDGRVAPPGA